MGAFMGIDYAYLDDNSATAVRVTRRDGYLYVVNVWTSNRTEPYVIADPTVFVGYGMARRPKPERFFNPDPPASSAMLFAAHVPVEVHIPPHPRARAPPVATVYVLYNASASQQQSRPRERRRIFTKGGPPAWP